eukprot:1068106-Alexandrium_andersonii.AAC.1
MLHPPRCKGSSVSEAIRFGARLTCDFLAAESGFMAGVHGVRDVFVARDIWSGLSHAFAIPDRGAKHVVEAAKMLAGDRVWDIRKMWS